MTLLGMISVFQYISLEAFISRGNRRKFCANMTFSIFLSISFLALAPLKSFFFLVISTGHAEVCWCQTPITLFPCQIQASFSSIFKSIPYSLKNNQTRSET